MTPFLTITGPAVPLLLDDINTDQIAPQQIDRSLDPDYRVMLFRRQRQDAAFILNRPQYQSAAILVGGSNFGCGPGGADIAFDIAPSDRMRLIEGLDDIGLTLKHADDIAAWERRTAAATPWLQMASDSRRQ